MEGPTWAFALRWWTYVRYLRYVLVHKWWVLWWGLKLKVPLWTLVMHDMSKFSREEWTPYAIWFYTRAPDGREWYAVYKEAMQPPKQALIFAEPWMSARALKASFDQAWSHHYLNNDHHPEYYSRGTNVPMPMPHDAIRHMVADWMGAGYAKGDRDVWNWYAKQKMGQQLHPATRVFVEQLLADLSIQERLATRG